MSTRWGDCFSQVGAAERGTGRKTSKAEVLIWQGYFEGALLCIISTVRLTGSNLAHFLVNSGARIGAHDWNLCGGHYVDLRVLSRDPLSAAALRRLGELARTEDTRPVAVRQGKQLLADAVRVPEPA